MSKNNKTPFQLKPKHLIRSLFLVSFIAVAALVAGIFSTLNSGKTDVPEEQNDTRIEIWRPNGAVEPETVQPAKDGDAKTASGNPVVPQDEKGEKAEEGIKNNRSAVHRGKRTETDKSENTPSDNNSSAAQNKPKTDSQPVENKAASNKPAAQTVENKPEKAKAPESKPTPKAEPEAKPQAKPRNKDNLDNLF